jgi:S1-C subfamily serine protease
VWKNLKRGFVMRILAGALLGTVSTLISVITLFGAEMEEPMAADALPPSDVAVDRFVTKALPEHLHFRYFKASNVRREGAELRLFGKLVVIPRENLYVDVTESVLADKGIAGSVPPDVSKPTIIKVKARQRQVLEFDVEVACRGHYGTWVPSGLEDYGQVWQLGSLRESLPASAVVSGSSEEKAALSALVRKVTNQKQKSPESAPKVGPKLLETEKAPEEAVKAVGLVLGSKGRGSGFWISSNLFLTCFHVIAKAGASTHVTDADGQHYSIEGIPSYSENQDVAVLQLSPAHGKTLELECNPKLGSKIWSIGNSLGMEVIAIDPGTLKAVGPKLIEITAQFRQGCSGGPIVDTHCKVVGMTKEFKLIQVGLDAKGKPMFDRSWEKSRKFAVRSTMLKAHIESVGKSAPRTLEYVQQQASGKELVSLFNGFHKNIISRMSISNAVHANLHFERPFQNDHVAFGFEWDRSKRELNWDPRMKQSVTYACTSGDIKLVKTVAWQAGEVIKFLDELCEKQVDGETMSEDVARSYRALKNMLSTVRSFCGKYSSLEGLDFGDYQQVLRDMKDLRIPCENAYSEYMRSVALMKRIEESMEQAP